MESVLNVLRRLDPEVLRFAAGFPRLTAIASGDGRDDGTDSVLALCGYDKGEKLEIWLPLRRLFALCFDYPVSSSALGLNEATLLNLAYEVSSELEQLVARGLPFVKDVSWRPTGVAPATSVKFHPAVVTDEGLIYWSRDNASYRPAPNWRNTCLENVRLPSTWVFGQTALTRNEQAGLRVGDLIVGQWLRLLRVQDALRFGFFIEGRTMILNNEASPDDEMIDTGPESLGSNVDDVPMALRFVMRGSDMTVAQLADLQIGSVLPIACPDTLLVNVVTRDGTVIAKGELVAVGEKVGVQLTQLSAMSVRRPRRSAPEEA